MRKLQFLLILMLSSVSLGALPIGNPSDPCLFSDNCGDCCDASCDPCFNWCEAFSLRVGFYGDYVFNRHMAVTSSNNGSDIDDTELFTNAGTVVVSMYDWIDIFATVGTTQINITTDGGAFSTNSTIVELDFETNFSWSVGARTLLWSCGCFNFGLEGQYFSTNPDLNSMIRYASGGISYFNSNNGSRYSEWQVGAAASLRVETCYPSLVLVPYMGIKWACSNFDIGDVTFSADSISYTLRNLESKKLWGYAVGVSAVLCDYVGVTVEGRFADEKALYTTMQLRY